MTRLALAVLAVLFCACGGACDVEPADDAGTPDAGDAGWCYPVTQRVCVLDGDGGRVCHWETRPCPK